MTLVESILAYSAATGIHVVRVGRDGLRAWRRERGLGWPRDLDAAYPAAKAEAARMSPPSPIADVPPGLTPAPSMGEVNPEVHPLPPALDLVGVSTYRRTAEGGQWTIARKRPESPEELILRLMDEVPRAVSPREATIPVPRATTEDLLAVYPLGDPHVGLLAWQQESGADFDLGVCESLMVGAMNDLVSRGPRSRHALIINLGDFFHYDNAQSRTTRGDHSLDTDSRAPKVLAVGMRIMVALIDACLAHHETVIVDNRIGNHDGHTSLMLSLALGAYYRHEPRAVVPPTVSHRAYYEHGAVLIGTTHGDQAKPDDLAAIMAAERPEAWGRTKHRYWLTGHVHHISRKESRGCVIESFRTLAARDSWHAGQGYVAGRDMHRIVYDRAHGEVSREVVSVGALLERGRAA